MAIPLPTGNHLTTGYKFNDFSSVLDLTSLPQAAANSGCITSLATGIITGHVPPQFAQWRGGSGREDRASPGDAAASANDLRSAGHRLPIANVLRSAGNSPTYSY